MPKPYLHKITVRHLDEKKPKQLIDEQLVAEIKAAVVMSLVLSVTEIVSTIFRTKKRPISLKIYIFLQKVSGDQESRMRLESVRSSPLL